MCSSSVQAHSYRSLSEADGKVKQFGIQRVFGNLTIPPEEIDKLRGVSHFAISALRKKEHISHFNLEQALGVIQEVNPGQAYLTHISHMMEPTATVEAELPENVHFAFDMQSIDT